MIELKEADEFTQALATLRQMITALPIGSELILKQFEKVIESLVSYEKARHKFIEEHIDDAILDFKMLEFDLEATKRERDAFLE